jgi:hypothetical protein
MDKATDNIWKFSVPSQRSAYAADRGAVRTSATDEPHKNGVTYTFG